MRYTPTLIAVGCTGLAGAIAGLAYSHWGPAGTVVVIAGMALLAGVAALCVRRQSRAPSAVPSAHLGEPPDTIDWDRFMTELAEWSAGRAKRER